MSAMPTTLQCVQTESPAHLRPTRDEPYVNVEGLCCGSDAPFVLEYIRVSVKKWETHHAYRAHPEHYVVIYRTKTWLLVGAVVLRQKPDPVPVAGVLDVELWGDN